MLTIQYAVAEERTDYLRRLAGVAVGWRPCWLTVAIG